MEDKFRRTPTWHAKCRISDSGRPLRFEHWGAHGDFASYRSTSDPLMRTKMKIMNNTRDARFILVRATVVV